jgi:predicted DNA-binding transcriptional regulator AlpA
MSDATNDALLVDVVELARMLSVGRTSIFRMQHAGLLGPRPVRLCRRVLWRKAEVERWVEAGCPPRTRWPENKTA